MKIKSLFFVIILFSALAAFAQDTNYARHILKALTSEDFHGRGYSFRGDSIAASFLRSELRRLGVEPLVENYYQPYNFSVFSMEGPLSLTVGDKAMQPYTDFRVPAWSKSTWGDFKVIQVEPEVLVDTEALRKFLKKNNELLQDVFVFVDASKYAKSDLDISKRIMKSVSDLQRRNPFNSRGVMVGLPELNTYAPSYTNYQHGYAYIEVKTEVLPKRVKTIHCNIFTQFHPNYKTQNIYGVVRGEVDTMIVFTAHYDHLGTMGDSVTFYGAHDNASGVAAVMNLAKIAVNEHPHYTQVFCFFSGEETGLCGSKYAVDHPVFDFKKVRLLINIDMFCGGDEGLMVFNADVPETEPFVERLEKLNKTMQIAPEIRRRKNRPNSDHYHFSKHLPAIFILTMGQRYGGYHDPYDTCERCGLENYVNYLTLIQSLAL